MREKTIEAYLTRRVQALDWLTYKFTSPGNRGVPDRLVVRPDGTVSFVELKAPGGLLAPAQAYQIAKLRAGGAHVVVLWSKSDVDAFIASFTG